jgi:hypothetical protein
MTIKGRTRAFSEEVGRAGPRTGQALSWGCSLPSPAWTLVTPLLQAHLTWARDEHEGRGTSTSLTLGSDRLASPPFALAHALDPSGLGHATHSLVGSGTPLSRNADNSEGRRHHHARAIAAMVFSENPARAGGSAGHPDASASCPPKTSARPEASADQLRRRSR